MEKHLPDSISPEKAEAFATYLNQKGPSLEGPLGEFLEKLYEKTVPGQVKKYLAAKQKPAENPVLHTPGTACPAGGKQRGLGVRIAAGGKASGTVVLDEQASHFFSKGATKSATILPAVRIELVVKNC